MAASRDYYKVLAVKRDATAPQIKAAFRKKAMRYHPDHNPGKEAWANKKLQGIIQAYEVLSNPASRRLYNRKLAAAEEIAIRTEVRSRPKTTKQYVVDIMRHRATPSWARTVAFAYIFFDFYSKESRRVE
jgi:DnaJ-class molecular chaperone